MAAVLEMDATKAEIIAWREIEGLSWKEIEEKIQEELPFFKLSMNRMKEMFADRWGKGVWNG